MPIVDLPPTARQSWSAVAVAAVALVGFGVAAPFSGRPVAQLNALFPSLDAIVFVSSVVSAALLFAQFSISGSRALFALANGYFFAALIVIPHALTFADAFSPTGLLGAGIQTGSWLFIFWHFGFAAGLLAYAMLRVGKYAIPKASTSAMIGWSVAIVFILVCGFTWLATAGAVYLPPIILDNTRISPLVVYPIVLTMLISAAALVVLLFHRRSVLDQWLIVVALVLICELAFSGLLPSVRFSVGFYAGRVFSLITSSIVLIVVLVETIRLYARVVQSNAMLQQERNNKLMNIEAIAASIAHEIKQPLGVIELNASSAHLILKQPKPNLADIQSILDEMRDAGSRINETLNGVRSLFGRIDQKRQLVNLNEVVLDAMRSSRAELINNGVMVRTKLASELPSVYGARNQLHEVISNLIHNAVEAMSSTADQVRVLELRTEHGRNAIVVEVVDTGPGIDPAQRAKIFEAFVTTKSHGSGLGLAICWMIVERHAGQLSVSSADPHGAVFRITLPQARLSSG
jgi:signal transduction histidine kinase